MFQKGIIYSSLLAIVLTGSGIAEPLISTDILISQRGEKQFCIINQSQKSSETRSAHQSAHQSATTTRQDSQPQDQEEITIELADYPSN